jgi:hypothetical protein
MPSTRSDRQSAKPGHAAGSGTQGEVNNRPMDSTGPLTDAATREALGWRFPLGILLFTLGFACPSLIPLVAATELSSEGKVAISGLLLLGIPELFTMAAAAVLGKDGFRYLKQRLWAVLSKFSPPEKVGPWRYRLGLIAFTLPLLWGWLLPYIQDLVPGYEARRFALAAVGDVLMVVSLFVLGGEFWDKLRSLFVREATVLFPEPQSAGSKARS